VIGEEPLNYRLLFWRQDGIYRATALWHSREKPIQQANHRKKSAN
jgi:hypothetical protein